MATISNSIFHFQRVFDKYSGLDLSGFDSKDLDSSGFFLYIPELIAFSERIAAWSGVMNVVMFDSSLASKDLESLRHNNVAFYPYVSHYYLIISLCPSDEYLSYRKLPEELRQRVLTFFNQKYVHQRYFNEEEVLSDVSKKIRDDIIRHTCRDVLNSMPYLK